MRCVRGRIPPEFGATEDWAEYTHTAIRGSEENMLRLHKFSDGSKTEKALSI